LDFKYYDLRPVLYSDAGDCMYQPRNMHWTTAGHRTVAKYLGDVLLTDGFLPEGITYLIQDSVFMMPHLGVLSTVHQKAAFSVFDKDCVVRLGTVVSPRGIPYKGQVLNQIASKFLNATSDIVPNWKIDSPDPMVTVGHFAEPIKVEMVIRGYLTGHAWREYRDGKRALCGIPLPDGMKEHQKFEKPIITNSTEINLLSSYIVLILSPIAVIVDIKNYYLKKLVYYNICKFY